MDILKNGFQQSYETSAVQLYARCLLHGFHSTVFCTGKISNSFNGISKRYTLFQPILNGSHNPLLGVAISWKIILVVGLSVFEKRPAHQKWLAKVSLVWLVWKYVKQIVRHLLQDLYVFDCIYFNQWNSI